MTDHLTDGTAQLLVEGSLVDDPLAEARAHLAGCAGCKALVESYQALGDALGGLESPPVPADFTEGVLRRIQAREEAAAFSRKLALGIVGGAAALAVGLLAISFWGSWAPVLGRVFQGLGRAAAVLSITAGVAAPILSALRLQIALACVVLSIPLLIALSRLVPRRAEAGV